MSCGRTDASYELITPSIHPDNYEKEIVGCWIADRGVSWCQWLALSSSTGVLTPNISVFWNPGNLYIAINHYGRGTYDNQIDYSRNHGVITPNIRSVVNNSDMFVGMIIEDGLGQDIWNSILTFNG